MLWVTMMRNYINFEPAKEWKAYEEMNIESLLTSANKLKNFACICEKELNSLAYIKEIYCSIVNCKV